MSDSQNKRCIDVIIPSFHSRDLTSICVRSLIRFCPSNVDLGYIIVENSDDISYKNNVTNLGSNIKWINNPTSAIGSEANAEAIEVGLKYISSNIIMMLHCDVCITNSSFVDNMLKKYDNGYKLVGCIYDIHPKRIGAIHISSLMTSKDIANSVSYIPHYSEKIQNLDVGDELTQYCREKNIQYYCFKNTHNDPKLAETMDEKYRSFNVVRCIDDNNKVMLMHLGRGISKTMDKYHKKGRVYLNGWKEFCNKIISE